MRSRGVLLFVKFPEPGRVKTRIGAVLGPEKAAAIYRELVARVCACIPGDLPVSIHFDPPEKEIAVRAWIGPLLANAIDWQPQAGGDLGARLAVAFARAFETGTERVVAIGSDCIEITPSILESAFDALDTHDVAVGPATDGGYYALALRAPQPALFENVRWSSAHTLADTLLRASGLRVHQMPVLRDVDTAEDWEAAKKTFADRK